ncbi:hypothetical protein AA0119_g13352 [Alternaria tenuissima]|uniref:Uncharacterized protein n=1 Tax=Alternaria tenuissima TaxID=119927 RepID=A0ABY0FR40_9PLEO|nr:hypothetical protein AA0119_g13352 [Alternaria tenuissima]
MEASEGCLQYTSGGALRDTTMYARRTPDAPDSDESYQRQSVLLLQQVVDLGTDQAKHQDQVLRIILESLKELKESQDTLCASQEAMRKQLHDTQSLINDHYRRSNLCFLSEYPHPASYYEGRALWPGNAHYGTGVCPHQQNNVQSNFVQESCDILQRRSPSNVPQRAM